ncbi:hypothetical protein A2U01_0064891, partial [Trifolium medium]|nr:hypothetical protein [Trifolium medium]
MKVIDRFQGYEVIVEMDAKMVGSSTKDK